MFQAAPLFGQLKGPRSFRPSYSSGSSSLPRPSSQPLPQHPPSSLPSSLPAALPPFSSSLSRNPHAPPPCLNGNSHLNGHVQTSLPAGPHLNAPRLTARTTQSASPPNVACLPAGPKLNGGGPDVTMSNGEVDAHNGDRVPASPFGPLSVADVDAIKLSDLILRVHDNRKRVQLNATASAYFISPRDEPSEEGDLPETTTQQGSAAGQSKTRGETAAGGEEEQDLEGDMMEDDNAPNQQERKIFGTPKVSAKRQAELEDEFLRVMQQRFLLGLDDTHFDYAAIDADCSNDDFLQIERDLQEKYFDDSD
eukprot:gb/GEZN01008403.1/.p1 GENE.gb/GEZN01008403.1/~~gb/GEZN01008403.1/.p1  ORF type:complete len:308 (+),score=75.35 gb/GEZN01008403.1/:363-1286(+)